MEGEHNEKVYEPARENLLSRFQPLGRTLNRARESEEDYDPVRCGRLYQESETGECIYAGK